MKKNMNQPTELSNFANAIREVLGLDRLPTHSKRRTSKPKPVDHPKDETAPSK